MSVKVMIGCARPMVAAGIARMVGEMPGVEVTASVAGGPELLEQLKREPCDVVLLDFCQEAVQETVQEMKRHHPQVKVVLILQDELTVLKHLLQTGALGYLQQRAGKAEIEQAIRRVNAGNFYIEEDVAAELARRMGSGKHESANTYPPAWAAPAAQQLSKREVEILRLIGQEYSSSEIAEQLFISNKTVETHRRNIMKKLNVRNLIGLLKYALQHDLIE